ncbi:hypothetical protein BT69DRAFT_1333085 [Atractiella rhizophila]|nr:hypothetical protein BT69DRAFT_1333085 [Atractiella rhizophila]
MPAHATVRRRFSCKNQDDGCVWEGLHSDIEAHQAYCDQWVQFTKQRRELVGLRQQIYSPRAQQGTFVEEERLEKQRRDPGILTHAQCSMLGLTAVESLPSVQTRTGHLETTGSLSRKKTRQGQKPYPNQEEAVMRTRLHPLNRSKSAAFQNAPSLLPAEPVHTQPLLPEDQAGQWAHPVINTPQRQFSILSLPPPSRPLSDSDERKARTQPLLSEMPPGRWTPHRSLSDPNGRKAGQSEANHVISVGRTNRKPNLDALQKVFPREAPCQKLFGHFWPTLVVFGR